VFQHCNQCSGFKDPRTQDPEKRRALANKGTLDARAAIAQATQLGQPAGTPIYFGVDFNPVFDGEGQAECNGVIFRDNGELLSTIKQYFMQINDAFRPQDGGTQRWKIGVYGAGFICDELKETQYRGAALADYFWLSASIGFKGHSLFHDGREWHLYQNKIEIPRLDYSNLPNIEENIDTNVTNPSPNFSYFGQWRRDRPVGRAPGVPAEDAKRILAGRGFYRAGLSWAYATRNSRTGTLEGRIATPATGHTFRIIERYPRNDNAPESVAVNFLEGEQRSGYFYASDVVLGLNNGMPDHG
jgi:hypothetical protein